MRTCLILAAFLSLATATVAEAGSRSYGYGGAVRVKPYVSRNGTYVQPHARTRADGTRLNNWSTKGNVNPYTGRAGTRGW